MANFTAKERTPATDAPPAPPPSYRVNPEACHYTGVPHSYRAVLFGRFAPKSFPELIAPGAWDDCELRPWDVIEVLYGPTPMEAKEVRLLVITGRQKGLRGFEREAGLVERDHTVVGYFDHPDPVTVNWGDQPVTELDESTAVDDKHPPAKARA